MNLKYYLRGLGVGIVVTSLILGIGLGSRKETLSNEEIKERARALGMVEEPVTVAEAAAQQEEAAKTPKYVFLFIGDGMSYPQFRKRVQHLRQV